MNSSADEVAEVWVPTVTLTLAVPDPAGDVALQEVALEQLTPVAVTLPKSTAVSPSVVENPVPVTVTEVPPAAGPRWDRWR